MTSCMRTLAHRTKRLRGVSSQLTRQHPQPTPLSLSSLWFCGSGIVARRGLDFRPLARPFLQAGIFDSVPGPDQVKRDTVPTPCSPAPILLEVTLPDVSGGHPNKLPFQGMST